MPREMWKSGTVQLREGSGCFLSKGRTLFKMKAVFHNVTVY